jgi:tape measure domain-containing protein
MNAGEVKVKIGADTSEFKSKLSEVNGKLGALGKGLGGAMGAVAEGIGAVVVGLGVMGGAVAKVGIEYNAMKEQALIAWETILGSAKEAEATVKRLEQMGALTPFEYEDLDKAAKLLQMAGFEGEKLFSTLTSVGDAVSAIGGGADELKGVSMALFQMASKGKVSAEEMNQLAERGIPAWKIVAEQTGKSVKELMKMSEQGKLFADDVLPKLVEGMGDKFGGAMERQSQTFNGLISTLRDNLKMFAGELTGGLFERIKGILPPIIKAVENMHNAFKKGGFSGLFKSMFPPGIVAVAQGIFNGLKGLFDWYKSYVKAAFSGEGNVGESFVRIFNTIKSIAMPILQDAIAFFKDIIGQFTAFWKQNGDQIIQAVKNMWSIIASVFQFVAPVILFIVQTVWNSVKDVIQGAVDIIIGIVKVFAGIFTGDWSKMWEGIKQLFSGAIQAVWGIMNLMFFGRILKGIGSLASGAWNGIKSMWTGIVNFFKSGGTAVMNTAKSIWQTVVNTFNALRSTGLSIFQSFRTVVSAVWQAIKTNVVNAAKALWSGTKSAFQNVLNTARSIFNSVKSAITNPIQAAKNTVLGIISAIKSAFARMRITIPKPRLPKISVTMKKGVMGIPYPDFDVSWHAKGGIFRGASIIGVGEKGDEAVVPLSQKHRMKPFATAVAGMIKDTGALTGETIINNYFNIQATIREEADIQRLSENLNELQKRTQRAGGVRVIGG